MALTFLFLGLFFALASCRPSRLVSSLVGLSKQSKAIVSTPLGIAVVINNCAFAVNSNIVHSPRPDSDGPPEELFSVLAPGESGSHPFLHDPGMGISWKLAPTNSAGAPVQFEWTWVPDQHRAYWDISMIDAGGGAKRSFVDRGEESADGEEEAPAAPAPAEGEEGPPSDDGMISHPFAEFGLSLQPIQDGSSTEAGGMCQAIACNAGEAGCQAAYNFPEDWHRQHDCPEEVSLQLTLCG